MIENKQQALAFLHNKDNEEFGKHRWHNHATFKAWIDEMLDEIFDENTTPLENKFGVKALEEINNLLIGSQAGLKTLAGFVKYRNEIKKPLKTSRPLKQFTIELMKIEDAGFDIQSAIDLMQDNEWQTIKLEWVQKQLKSNKPIQSTELEQFGFKGQQ